MSDLFLLGGEPGEVGMADDVVEGEEAAEEDELVRLPAMPDVGDAKGAVEGAAVHVGVAQVGGNLRQGMLPGDAGVNEPPYKGGGSLRRAMVMLRELRSREDAGVKADESQPDCLPVEEAELVERGLAASQVGHVGSRKGHVQKSTTWSA